MATYRHTQRAPLCWLLYGMAAGIVVGAWFLREIPVAAYVMLGSAAFTCVFAAAFHQLTIEDAGDRLLIAFGPLPLFRNTVRYADVVAVEVGRTTLMEGWGIHVSPRGGWVWNLWGRDCVIIQLRHSRLTVGTDDATNLTSFLRSRISSPVPTELAV